jgi:serine/threonine protein kinase
MGEVYRALDTRLDRVVALKVLPEHLAGAEAFLQRFEREAKVISSLSHPNICTLYDIGSEGDTRFLVMEYLEGESLAQRLGRGPLPIEEVVRLGIEIADALDKAHRGGVVHRDLKPGNVMLVGGGVKLLDFGLAKLSLQPTDESSASQFSRMLTETPATEPLTVEGTLLGTFQYMAPEQVEGREANARTDLFAFGALLYEMATGKKAFAGQTQASVIGAIMRGDPEPVSKLAPLASPAFDRVVQTCLAKDPEKRWATAHDVKLQLQWIAEGGSQIGLPAPLAARRRNRERLAWGVAALATLAAVGLGVGFVERAPEPAPLVRFEFAQPAKLPVVGSPKLSPDGKYLAFDGTDDSGTTQIYLRPLSSLEAVPLPGTEGTTRPFWSPDSQYLAFFSGGKLKKVPVTGGPPQPICDAPTGADGSWSERGVILYDGSGSDPIRRVPAAGGVPTEVPLQQAAGEQVGWPQFLPGGERFLFVVVSGENEALKIADVDGSNVREILAGQSRVEYAPPGYLIYVRDETLVAHPFDARSGELSGEPVPVAEGLGTDAVGLADFSASANGSLAFRAGLGGQTQLVWVDRKGQPEASGNEPASYGDFALSPDGRWLALQLQDAAGREIWLRDLKRGVTSRLTFDAGDDGAPVWSPDGSKIAIRQEAKGGDEEGDVAILAVATGRVERSFALPGPQGPTSWSPDGKNLLAHRRGEESGWDLWVLPIDPGQEPYALIDSPFTDIRGRFSPDGRWVAYQSNESGRYEVYVRAFDGSGGKWQISPGGGEDPHWGPSGRELFYVSPQQNMMRVPVTAGATFDAGIPEVAFEAKLVQGYQLSHYQLSGDGERFLTLAPISEGKAPPTTLVLNWPAGLR